MDKITEKIEGYKNRIALENAISRSNVTYEMVCRYMAKGLIKNLNEETVKRESLIDFLKFHYKDNPIYIERKKFNKDADAYLNQLNE